MKKLLLNGVIFLSLAVCMYGCRSECKQTIYYTANVPLYEAKSVIRSSVQIETPLQIDSVAEMLSYKQSLFFRNGTDGIHIVDNANPGQPENHTYIKIKPCFAMEAHDDQLFVIHGTDLVVLDISNPKAPTLMHRVNDRYNGDFAKVDSFVVDYRREEVVKVLDDFSCGDQFIFPEDEVVAGGISAPHGQLLALQNNLYSSDNQSLITYSLHGSAMPLFTNRNRLFNNFPGAQLTIMLDSLLLFGTGSGYQAFDITRNPNIPSDVGGFFAGGNCNHAAFWDSLSFAPMFQEKENDQFCFSRPVIGIVDISTRRSLTEVSGYIQPMYVHTHNERLLLCNGTGGFRVFERPDRITLSDYTDQSGESTNVHARLGMLLGDKNAIIYGNDGLFQYDIQDRTMVIKLSEIK
jgi:hypothetical protein